MDANRGDCILIFRLGSIGDTVVALPCFHAIGRRFSGYRRILLTNSVSSLRASSAESVLGETGLIDEVRYYRVGDFSLKSALALMRELRALRPAYTIYLAERKSATSICRDVMFFKAAGLSRVTCVPWSRRLRECRIDPRTGELEYEAQRLARGLRRIAPVTFGPADWDLRLSDIELAKSARVLEACGGSQILLAIAPGTKIAAKAWGADNWRALLEMLAPRLSEAALIIVGAADERALGEEVARSWRGPVLNVCGTATPRETAAIFRRCKLLICHDSGPMHLAASQRTPCVALFGNLNRPRQWYPFGAGHRVIHEPRGVREIPVERVALEILAAIQESAPLALDGVNRAAP